MPLTPEEFYENATSRHSDNRVESNLASWETFPFETEGLKVRALRKPMVPEAPRNGEDPATCRTCAATNGLPVWANERWQLVAIDEPSGGPLVLVLGPRTHCDYGDLSEDMAAEFGRVLVALVRIVESFEHIARAHVLRWGDGSAHMHVFISARPEGFSQLRGTFLALWDDVLPPIPRSVRDADAARVGEELTQLLGGSPRAR